MQTISEQDAKEIVKQTNLDQLNEILINATSQSATLQGLLEQASKIMGELNDI